MEAGPGTTASRGGPSARPPRSSSCSPTGRRWARRWPSLASLALIALVACDRRPSGTRTDDAAPASHPPSPPSELDRIDAAIARGGAFLRGRQGADGSVRTSPYPAFRDGL